MNAIESSNQYFLSIDVGNSFPNGQLFSKSASFEHLQTFSLKDLKKICERYKLNKNNTQALYSSVAKHSPYIDKLNEFEISTQDVHDFFIDGYFLDMKVNYSPTLGVDRLVQSYYIYKNFQIDLPLVLIDVGTFTTIDLVNADGFEGGWILPGPKLLQASYKKGYLLPTPELPASFQRSFPHDTEVATSQGIGLIFHSTWNYLAHKYPKILLTGGQGQHLSSYLRPKDLYIPNLLHRALVFVHSQTAQRSQGRQ